MCNINEQKAKFKDLVHSFIKRDGITQLMDWLDSTDFYEAPASTKHHGTEPGGLCKHSLKVYELLKSKQDNESDESIAIVSLFHDLCKVNSYNKKFTNTNLNAYTYDDNLPLGHGEKSIIMLLQYIKLTEEEMLSIRHHMGAYNLPYYELLRLNKALTMYRLVLKLKTSDEEATFWYNT